MYVYLLLLYMCPHTARTACYYYTCVLLLQERGPPLDSTGFFVLLHVPHTAHTPTSVSAGVHASQIHGFPTACLLLFKLFF
jgi:hypothetical protein